MSMVTTHSNNKGDRVLKVYGQLNTNSETHYEAELFIKGISQGLESITPAQVKNRYPIFVSAILEKSVRV